MITNQVNNIVELIQQQIKDIVEKSIKVAEQKGELPQIEIPEIVIEKPREQQYGEFSTNVAMQITKQAKQPPRKIAEIIIGNAATEGTYVEKIDCAGPGFINFYLNNQWLYDSLKLITEMKEQYGEITIGKGTKVMVEFVSANPTGPLHMGNARGGALGDCIASVLEKAGYDVTREFYVNDAGNQIQKFGISLEARYIQQLKGEDAILFPEDGYQGEDIIEHAKAYIAEYGDALLLKESEERRSILAQYALPKNIERIRDGLQQYGISYDVWFSEKSLYDSKEVERTISELKEKGYTVESEDAIWLNGEKLGLEKNEVLVRNNGFPTYMAADIAYHRDKFVGRKFDWVINLWGADHHGHVGRMKAAMIPFGIEPDKLQVVLFQLVRLYRNGEIARMSKRTGKSISLTDLLDEVGKDAARFFFNMKASGSHLDFDLDLAVKQSNENPVFYVQYAHARICSMLAKLEEEGIPMPEVSKVDLSLLKEKEELELIKKLAELPEEIRISASTLEPSRLTRYVMDVAGGFHSFYSACSVKNAEEELRMARIELAMCTKTVIRNVLSILKISSPERM